MRRFTLAAGVACAVLLTSHAVGQFNVTNTGGTTMPGQTVSTYRGGPLSQVGQKVPAAAPQAGQTVAGNAMQRPYDPGRPYDAFKGTNLDPNSLVAPLIGPDGKPIGQPDALDALSERIKAIFGILKPNPQRPNFAPGITRRTRERSQMMWRRD